MKEDGYTSIKVGITSEKLDIAEEIFGEDEDEDEQSLRLKKEEESRLKTELVLEKVSLLP